MPDIIVADEGEVELMRIDFKAELVTPRVWHLRLFKNDYTPDKTVTLGDLDQATFSGYFAVPLDPDVWTDPVSTAGQAVTYYGTDYTAFTASSLSQVIFGYYITFDDGAGLLWVQRFDTFKTVSPGNPVLVWPALGGRSQYEPSPPP